MAKRELKQVTSPKGKVFYAHIYKPEVYDGAEIGYSIQLALSAEDTEKMKKVLKAEILKAQKSEAFKGKKWTKNPNMGVKELEVEGETIEVFKFKTKHQYTTKTGEVFNKTIPVFDAQGTPIKDVLSIGNGTIARVRFSISPYHKSSTNCGVTLYLEAVQVIDLVEYNPSKSAEDYGFEAEEGGFTYDGDTEETFEDGEELDEEEEEAEDEETDF